MAHPGHLHKARPGGLAKRQVTISAGPQVTLGGDLALPAAALGMIIVPHAARVSRRDPYNLAACDALNRHGLATLLLDCLTPQEKASLTFDVGSHELAARLASVTERLCGRRASTVPPVGYLGRGKCARVALLAAALVSIGAIVLVSPPAEEELFSLARVSVPILLIADGSAFDQRSSTALRRRLGDLVALEVIPGAGSLGEGDPGPHIRAFDRATEWFAGHLRPRQPPRTTRTAPALKGRRSTTSLAAATRCAPAGASSATRMIERERHAARSRK